MVKPILKWAGGKRQILTSIKECLPIKSKFNRYHEPFFGGGALFFDLEPKQGSINDINPRLMNFYKVVRDCPNKLIEQNTTHRNEEEYFYQKREEFNTIREEVDDFHNNIQARVKEASLLLYLNRTCFNGLYRENSDGEFNVPHGDYSNPDFIQKDRIRKASRVLQDTEINQGDFSYIEEEVVKDDLVYFDPPYKPVDENSSFVEYHSEEFGQEQQEKLRDIAVRLDKKGAHVVISNSPPIRELYEFLDEFQVGFVGARRSINSNGDNRGEVKEILVTNVPEEIRMAGTPSLNEYSQ